MSAQPVVSDLEDGEVTESDSDAVVVEVPIKDDVKPQLVKSEDATEKAIEVADDSDRPKESSTSKTQRKRKNRKLRKEEEQLAKASLKSAKIKQLEAAEMDEYEMLCVNGASPPRMPFDEVSGPRPEYASDNSEDQRYYRATQQERRELRRQRNRRRRRTASTDDPNSDRDGNTCSGVCLKNYRGICMDPGCKRSHEFRQPRKLELCKFFLTAQCMKSNHCTYMHNDFPCKYFYLGIAHDKAKCQFAHGGPLEPAMQGALLKHIERAPKSILGDFPRVYQTQAGKMMRAQHLKLLEDQKYDAGGATDSSSGRSKPKKRKKSRRDDRDDRILEFATDPTDETGRWSPSGKLRVPAGKPAPRPRPADAEPVLARPEKANMRLDSIPSVLNVGQILGLRAIGIEYSRQIDQLTMAQMNEIGLNIGHIKEIQDAAERLHASAGDAAAKMNTATELIGSNAQDPSFTMSSLHQDVDMRQFPVLVPHPIMPDLSAFGIKSTPLAPVNPLLPCVPTPSISDQASCIPNPLLDSHKSVEFGSDDAEDEDDGYGQLVIESDAENDDADA